MDATLLENCLRSLAVGEWKLERRSNGPRAPWWVLKFRTERRAFRFHVAETDGWLLVQCDLPVRFHPACRASVLHYLLELNHQLRLIKFALGDRDMIHISVEQPMSRWECAGVGEVLDGLRLCCQQYYREIELLAQEPRLAEVFQSLRGQGSDLAEPDELVSVISVSDA